MNMKPNTEWPLQLLQHFSLESLNVDEVNFKLKLIGFPDKQILIAFST